MAEGALEWARNAQGETYGQIERSVFFSWMLHEDHKSSQSAERKKYGFFDSFVVIPAGQSIQSPKVLSRDLTANESER
jgi:hypothetical protein